MTALACNNCNHVARCHPLGRSSAVVAAVSRGSAMRSRKTIVHILSNGISRITSECSRFFTGIVIATMLAIAASHTLQAHISRSSNNAKEFFWSFGVQMHCHSGWIELNWRLIYLVSWVLNYTLDCLLSDSIRRKRLSDIPHWSKEKWRHRHQVACSRVFRCRW